MTDFSRTNIAERLPGIYEDVIAEHRVTRCDRVMEGRLLSCWLQSMARAWTEAGIFECGRVDGAVVFDLVFLDALPDLGDVLPGSHFTTPKDLSESLFMPGSGVEELV